MESVRTLDRELRSQRVVELELQLDEARDEIRALQRLLDPEEQRRDLAQFSAAFDDLQGIQRLVRASLPRQTAGPDAGADAGCGVSGRAGTGGRGRVGGRGRAGGRAIVCVIFTAHRPNPRPAAAASRLGAQAARPPGAHSRARAAPLASADERSCRRHCERHGLVRGVFYSPGGMDTIARFSHCAVCVLFCAMQACCFR